MASINSITIIGRLGRDPDRRETNSGKTVCSFSVAVDRRQKDETDWFQVTCWDRLAELACEYLQKGRQVGIRGRMQSRQYEREGQKVTAWEVVAEDLQFLGSREESTEPAPAPAPAQQRRPAPPQSRGPRHVVNQAWAAHGPGELPDDDVPF